MSKWRVIWPGDEAEEEFERAIIPFPQPRMQRADYRRRAVGAGDYHAGDAVSWTSPRSSSATAELPRSEGWQREPAVERARLMFQNRRCPGCGYPIVLPIELDDAVIDRSGLPVPGTATLVGFRCQGCQTEWSIEPVSWR
ncbi:MAG: hypothetical protein KatS3mg113_0485 [Planctomycetaceae bacterium]|nr:MAG: hypothetical protein KatS3mg113_0485 [Planctomycetaceae bacterium]